MPKMVNAASNLRSLCFGAFKSFNKKYEEDNNVREAEEEDEGGGEEADGDGGGCKEGIGHRGEGVSEEYCAEEEEMGNTHNHAIDIGSSVEKNTKTDYTFDGNNCADGNEEDVTHNEHPYPEGEEKFTLNVSTGGVSSSSTTATPPCEVKTDEPSYCTSGSNQRERSSTLDATVFGEINKGANIFMGNRNKECPVNSNLNADVNLNTDADIGLHPFKNASVYNGAKVCDDPNMWSSFNGGNNIGAVNTASTLSTDVCNNASYLYSGEVHVRNDVVQDRKVDKGTATVTMVTDVEEFRKENYSTEEDRYDKSESKIYNRHTGEKVMRKKISAHTGVNDAALTASSANVERILMDYYRGKINSKNYEEKLSNSCRFFIYTSNPYNYDVKMIKENCLTIYQLLYREKKKWCSIYICTNDGPMSNFNYHLYKILCGKEDIYMYFFLLKKFIFSCYIYFNLVSIKIFSTFSNKGENIMLYDFTHIIKGKNASLGESSGEFGGSSDCGGAERKQQWDQLSQKSIRQSPGQSPRHASSQSTPHLPTVVEAVRGRSLSPSGGTNQHHANPFGATTWENQAEECNRETETPPQRNRSSNIYNLNSENNQIEEEAQFLNFLYDPCKHLYVNKVNSSDNYFHLFNKEESSDIKKKLQLFISTHSPTMINITKRWNSFYLNKNRISSFVEKYKDVNYSSGDNLKKNGKERFISEFVETFCVMIDEVNPPRRSRTNMVVRQHSEGMHLRRGGTSRKALSWMAKHGRGRPSITKKEYEAGNTRWPHKLRRAYTTADEVTDMGDKNCNRDRSGSYGDRFGRSFGHFDEKARSVSMGGGTHHYTTGGKFEWRGETAEEGKNTSNAEDQPEGNPPSEHTNMKAPQTTDGESKKTPPSVVEPNRVPNYSSSSQWYKEGMGTSGCTAEVIAKFLGSVNIRRSRMLLRKGGGSSGSDSDDSVGARESDSNQDSCDSDEQNTESESAYYGGKKYSNNGEGVTTNGEDGGKRGKKHPRNHIFLNNLNILIKDLNELYDYLENCRYGGGTRADGVGVNNSFFINDPKGSYHSAFGKGDNGGGEPEATDEVHDANRVQHGEAMNTEYLNRLKSGRNLSNLYSIGASCVDGGTYSDAGNSETSNAYGRGEEDFYNVDISSVDLKNFCSVCSGIQYDNFENPLNEGKNGKYKRLEVFMKESDFFCNCNNINIFQNENGNPNEDLKFGFNGEMTSEEYYMLRKNDIEKMNRTIDEIIYMNHQQGLGGSAGEGTDGGLPYENDDYEEEDDDEDDEADEDDDSDDEDDEGRTKVALKTRRKSTNVGEGVGITTGPGRRRGRVAKMELKSKYMGRGKNKMWANNTAAKDLSNKAATNREIRNMRKNKFGKYHQQTEKKNKTVKSLASPQNYEIKSARVKKLEKFTSVDQENLREVFGPTGVSGVYFEKSRSSWTAQYKVSGGKRRAKRFLVTKNMTYEEIENVKQQCIAYRKQMEKEYIKEFLNEDKKKTPSSVTSPSSEIGHVSVKKNKRRRKMKSFYDS